jgi:hypothetical protein
MTAAEFASLSELLTLTLLTLSPNTFRDVPLATSMAWKLTNRAPSKPGITTAATLCLKVG